MTIGEFSAITGISAYTMRYYEKKGLSRVSRDSARRRDYSADDIEFSKIYPTPEKYRDASPGYETLF